MKTFEIVLSEERNVTMTMYLNLESPEFHHRNRPLIVVLPGGGYSMCSDREAEIVALSYMAAGYQACVLCYTLKDKAGWPYPINDYDEAYEKIAENAEEWRIDMNHVATVGFSAGGHLAACTATVAKHRPNAAILVYAAIKKDIVDACQPGMPYPAEHVDGNTSPCFIVASRDDSLVNVSNSLEFGLALEKNGINFETHIYSFGQHGFSVATPVITTSAITQRAAKWVPDSITWLNEMIGEFTEHGFREPVLSAKINGNYEEFLSVNCTLGHMLNQPEESQKIIEALLEGIKGIAAERGIDFLSFCAAISGFTIKELLALVQTPEEGIKQIDAALRTIPNRRE